MNYSNIANILNNQLLKNAMGESVTIAEDLSNIVEVGTLVSNMSSDDLKDFKKNIVVGVYNYVIERLYSAKKFDIVKDAIEYGGGIQRIMASGLMTVTDSHLLNLINGVSYLDGKFYGTPISSKIYTNTKAYKIVHSISDDDFSQMFTSREDLSKYIGLIETTERNTIEVQLAELTKRVINKLAVDSYVDNRRIHLVTEFNNKLGLSDADELTYDDIKADRDKMSYFTDFCKSVLYRIADYIADINDKYNDGTVVTFTPKDKIKAIFISEFASDIKFLGNPNDHTTSPETIAFDTVSVWQNATKSMLPSMQMAMQIKTTDGEESTTYNNIVGIIYDRDACGITLKRDKTTVEYVGSEGFTNLHHHIANNYYVDSRLGSVVFTLD